MNAVRAAGLLLLLSDASAFAADAPATRIITVSAPDGTPLKGHLLRGRASRVPRCCSCTCATPPASRGRRWEPQLAAAGIHALAMDYRGFGESGGERFDTVPPQDAQGPSPTSGRATSIAAYAFLLAQPGVDKTRIGAAGGSCGVNQAVHVAQRHPEIRSLVLLAGPLDPDGARPSSSRRRGCRSSRLAPPTTSTTTTRPS